MENRRKLREEWMFERKVFHNCRAWRVGYGDSLRSNTTGLQAIWGALENLVDVKGFEPSTLSLQRKLCSQLAIHRVAPDCSGARGRVY